MEPGTTLLAFERQADRMRRMLEFTLGKEEDGQTLAAVLRKRLSLSWSTARTLCETRKVRVDANAERAADPARRVRAGQTIVVDHAAKKPLHKEVIRAKEAIVFEDAQLLIVSKPVGLSSVPYERTESNTAMDLVRKAWRASGKKATEQPLFVVHRIDKDTSGLLMFAKTRTAERTLSQNFRYHDIRRRYLCVVHGYFLSRTIESYMVKDRGDGLRGSLSPWKVEQGLPGRLALTHVEVLEHIGNLATVCAVQIETGKTHQIRIHLAEAGHPIIGERVYIRDFVRNGQTPLESSRLLLHAETLGFVHPHTQEDMLFQEPPPADFEQAVVRLRAAARLSVADQSPPLGRRDRRSHPRPHPEVPLRPTLKASRPQ
ncbi:MAG TPA: RluA family pseudouridine synthase [Pseudomonadota bacterium]|nr:RluA family pseudouridine synthase [Pseudomonadota bacterium]